MAAFPHRTMKNPNLGRLRYTKRCVFYFRDLFWIEIYLVPCRCRKFYYIRRSLMPFLLDLVGSLMGILSRSDISSRIPLEVT